MNFFRFFFIFFCLIFIFGCTEKTTFSGKIISEKELFNLKILNKKDLLVFFGFFCYIVFLFITNSHTTEKKKSKNFYNNKTEYSYLFVFEINNKNKIINKEVIDLLNKNSHKYIKEQTDNNIIRRGIIEKIFGGVGANPLPNSL